MKITVKLFAASQFLNIEADIQKLVLKLLPTNVRVITTLAITVVWHIHLYNITLFIMVCNPLIRA